MQLYIRSMRKNVHISQTELASAVGVSLRTVGSWERGESLPNVEQLWNCAVALGCTPNDLLGWKEEASERLTPAENEIVESYRHSTPQWQQHITMSARAAVGESKKVSESSVSDTANIA